MKTALFLGAGASVFAGQPTTENLLQHLRNCLKRRRNNPKVDPLLQDYVEHVAGADVYTDVEKLYDGVKTVIAIRANSNCGPISKHFGYHYDGVHTSAFTTTPLLVQSPSRSLNYEEVNTELNELLDTIRETVLDSFKIKSDTYIDIRNMYDMVWTVIERNGADKFQIFTTNYDMVMDKYAIVKKFEMINGFGPPDELQRVWRGTWDRNTDKPPLYLVRLHGSIRWDRAGNTIRETQDVTRRDAKDDIMIMPTEGGKDYTEDPFPTLLRYFEAELEVVEVLLVVGFSFRDERLVGIIKNCLDDGMKLITVSPTAEQDIRRVSTAKPKTKKVDGLQLKTVDSNIILCEQRFEPGNLDVLCVSLEAAYKLARKMRGNAKSIS